MPSAFKIPRVTFIKNHVSQHSIIRASASSSMPSSPKMKKHLSTIANSLIQKCAQTLATSLDALVAELESGWKPETNDYSRKLVEFCSLKALPKICCNLEEKIADGSFSQFTFDMMLAWESTTSTPDDDSYLESVAKEKEDKNIPLKEEGAQEEDIPLFYSDILPLLVDQEPSVGEDAFVWLGSLFPLVVDVVNGRFAFETLTAPTAHRLHFPAYDRYLKEIDKCIKYLRKQTTPKGVDLADDEFILHVEGTVKTQRVVRHIKGTSWPGRLTLTNYALYFEASGVISYENALKIDLSNTEVDHNVKPASTGPWGVPLFDKAVIYESSQLSECVVFEFPEMTSSTRRDIWLTLTKEIILLHQFLAKFKVESQLQAWEMHARTILGITRFHAARELLRISAPVPTTFLIFSLFEELPKGDYVLEELANSLKQMNKVGPCSATYILKSLNMSNLRLEHVEYEKGFEESPAVPTENLESLDSTVNQVREEAKENSTAKASVEGLKETGISANVIILMELLSPLKDVIPWFQRILSWERPAMTLSVLAITLLIIYKEWVRYAVAASLLWVVWKMTQARRERVRDECPENVVCTSSDQTTMESIVLVHQTLKDIQAMIETANITILRIQSILVSRSPKHTNQVMCALVGAAALLLVVPLKFIIMAITLFCFTMNLMDGSSDQTNRRLREWWESIPVSADAGLKMCRKKLVWTHII